MSAPRRPPRRAVDGVLLFDKPPGLSSNQALMRVKHLFNAEKAGHTGTLDPMATGLLPLCFGEATKFSGELLDADKRYLASVRLGVSTDTGDALGTVTQTRPVRCGAGEIGAVAAQFVGAISQVPPMYSALKRDGKPLYAYAREGVEVERVARSVCIHALTVAHVAAESFDMDVLCSKGTYIRSLAMEIGERLGCGAHLSALRRAGIGRFLLHEAVTLEFLESLDMTERDALLAPVDYLLGELGALHLEASDAARVAQGQRLQSATFAAQCGRVRLYAPDGRFMGVARVSAEGRLQPDRLLGRGAHDGAPRVAGTAQTPLAH